MNAMTLTAIAIATCGCGGAAATGATATPARSFASDSARVTNPWFPLAPGTRYVYRGRANGRRVTDVVRVTARTRVVNGVRAVVVDDRVYRGDGRLAERTTDWYAQDVAGNVWYLGEETATLDGARRVLSTEGSWEDGRDGARAGIFMPARPRAGQAFQQESYPGHAEDRFRIRSLRGRVVTPAVRSDRALLSDETTPLEPSVVGRKAYVRGIGLVLERDLRGGDEALALVRVARR